MRAFYTDAAQCAVCHGVDSLESARKSATQYPALVGGFGTLASLLYLNHIVPKNTILNAQRLTAIRMPSRDGFVFDPRPDLRPPR